MPVLSPAFGGIEGIELVFGIWSLGFDYII